MPVEANKAIIKNEGGNFELTPEGVYNAEVVDIVLKENQQGYKGKIVDKLWIKLGILDEEQRALGLMHFVSTAYTAGFKGGQSSKLYDFACAVMGEQLDDKAIDVNTLIGGRLRIVVKHKDSNGKTYSNITEVMKVDAGGKKLPELTSDEKSKLAIKERDSEPTIFDAEMAQIDKEIDLPDLGNLDLDSK
jgi:hypothetical protein